jgi:4-amino-4-deoxy-L-arabinose transferase-like glycosyltransferase
MKARVGTGLWVVIVISLAVRLYGLNWGLPHVYEEAQPIKLAWDMWGWGSEESFDPNPHFFRYPSLAMYSQLAGQAVLYAGMSAAGAIDSPVDFRVRYHTDPTPFYILGRLIAVLFAVATVWITFLVARSIAGPGVALVASALLAINPFHIGRSQMIEVDVPLTCFAMLAMLFVLRIPTTPSRRNYALAGLAIALATATKYTGALLVLPLLVAHVVAWRGDGRERSESYAGWRGLVWAGATAVVVFFIASPFVILDFQSFWKDLTAERLHMRLGHFGLHGESAWQFYASRLGSTILGWALVAFTLVGLVWTTLVERRPWALIAGAFVLPYWIAISSWQMMADRYALPVIPLLLVFAVVAGERLVSMLPMRRAVRWAGLAVMIIVAVIPLAAFVPDHLSRYQEDSRTTCLRWIEVNVPAGALIVTEPYGPPLKPPAFLWELDPAIYGPVKEQLEQRPRYAVTRVPMFQVQPERSSIFYDIDLYRDADLFAVTGSTRNRYIRDPERFPRQCAFYDSLQVYFEEVQQFEQRSGGPTITLFRHRRHRVPFAQRPVSGPRSLPPESALPASVRASYYYQTALNYESAGHFEQAVAGYQLALPHLTSPHPYRQVCFGMTRCLSALREWDTALEFLREARNAAQTDGTRDFVDTLEQEVRRRMAGGE